MLFESSYGTPELSEARMLGKSLYLPHNPLLSPSIVRNLLCRATGKAWVNRPVIAS